MKLVRHEAAEQDIRWAEGNWQASVEGSYIDAVSDPAKGDYKI